jgi:hypothetical protein
MADRDLGERERERERKREIEREREREREKERERERKRERESADVPNNQKMLQWLQPARPSNVSAKPLWERFAVGWALVSSGMLGLSTALALPFGQL